MPIKCYRKPNRSAKRYFMPCDVARAARNCAEDNRIRPEEVLACVAKGMGFSHISLSREGQVQEAAIVKGGKESINLAKGLIQRILRSLSGRIPSIAALLKSIAEILDRVDRVLDRILGPESEKVEDVLQPGVCNCKEGEVEKWQARLKRGAESAP